MSTTQLSASLGAIVLTFALLRLTVDRPGKAQAISPFFVRYNRFSLAIYVIHHAIHAWPIRFAGWQAHGDQWYYYGDVVSPMTAWLLTVVFVVVSYPLLGVWDRVKNRPNKHS